MNFNLKIVKIYVCVLKHNGSIFICYMTRKYFMNSGDYLVVVSPITDENNKNVK